LQVTNTALTSFFFGLETPTCVTVTAAQRGIVCMLDARCWNRSSLCRVSEHSTNGTSLHFGHSLPFDSIPVRPLSAAAARHCWALHWLCAIRPMCCCTFECCWSQVQDEGLVEARWLLGRAGPSARACAASASGLAHIHRCIASHRIASHRIASHRIASHRIASHRIWAATDPRHTWRIFEGAHHSERKARQL
jgi:hypothetical protein